MQILRQLLKLRCLGIMSCYVMLRSPLEDKAVNVNNKSVVYVELGGSLLLIKFRTQAFDVSSDRLHLPCLLLLPRVEALAMAIALSPTAPPLNAPASST